MNQPGYQPSNTWTRSSSTHRLQSVTDDNSLSSTQQDDNSASSANQTGQSLIQGNTSGDELRSETVNTSTGDVSDTLADTTNGDENPTALVSAEGAADEDLQAEVIST